MTNLEQAKRVAEDAKTPRNAEGQIKKLIAEVEVLRDFKKTAEAQICVRRVGRRYFNCDKQYSVVVVPDDWDGKEVAVIAL